MGEPDALHDAPVSTSACSASIVSAPSESRIPPGVQHHPGGGNVAELGTDGWASRGRSEHSSLIARCTLAGALDAGFADRADDLRSIGCRHGGTLRPRGCAPRSLAGLRALLFPASTAFGYFATCLLRASASRHHHTGHRPPRESQAKRGRASSPGGRTSGAVLAVTAAEHGVAVSRCLRERERTVGAVRQVGSDCPPAGIDSRPAFDLAGESLEACRPIDRRPAGSNGSVMLLSPHLYRDGKAGLVGAGGDGAPCIRRCEGARGILGRTRLGARDENASACEAQDRQRQHRLQRHDAPLMASGCLRARPWAPPSHHRL